MVHLPGVVLCGTVWYGVLLCVGYGMVKYGMVWYATL